MGYTPPPKDNGHGHGWASEIVDDPVVAKAVVVWLFVALLLSIGGMRCSVSVVSQPVDATPIASESNDVEGPR